MPEIVESGDGCDAERMALEEGFELECQKLANWTPIDVSVSIDEETNLACALSLNVNASFNNQRVYVNVRLRLESRR